MTINFIIISDYRPGIGVVIEKGPHRDMCGKVSFVLYQDCSHRRGSFQCHFQVIILKVSSGNMCCCLFWVIMLMSKTL